MIICAFDTLYLNANSLLFRGKHICFWIEEIFKNLDFYIPDKLEPKFDFLILFNFPKILHIKCKGIKEIIDFLQTQNWREGNIFSIKGLPFYAISSAAFKALNLSLKNGICFESKNINNVEIIELKEEFKVLDLVSDLREIEDLLVNYQIKKFINNGVIIEDFNNFYIDEGTEIGKGITISSGVVIKGKSKIGEKVVLFPNSYIENTVVGHGSVILPGCVLRDSIIEKNVILGPYCHLRAGSIVKEKAKIGNFVEMKKSVLGKGSKAMHLTYIGDAKIGKNVNVGAGTITCNYDGVNKNKTTIEDNVFIGSGTELVAPVTIHKDSYIGAGSTITEDVPEGSLAIARQKQKNLLEWVKRKRKKQKNKLTK